METQRIVGLIRCEIITEDKLQGSLFQIMKMAQRIFCGLLELVGYLSDLVVMGCGGGCQAKSLTDRQVFLGFEWDGVLYQSGVNCVCCGSCVVAACFHDRSSTETSVLVRALNRYPTQTFPRSERTSANRVQQPEGQERGLQYSKAK